ncbi:MAG TPA: serine/threonine-protein kinase [Kofleriaceae bacterium]|nr:serine/threonine-protein kinase [Kofleriaceae bacterium]
MTVQEQALPLLTRLGNFELVRLLAQGGMADIYLARQVGIGQFERHVAVKVLNAQRASDPESCALFLDEARLVGMLNHGNLASVHEVAAQGGVHYLAMEYVHGADLREILAQAQRGDASIAYECALTIVMQAAAGLDHAHRRCAPDGRPLHLVHRDVSLSNIMVGHDGSVKLIDFGIATSAASIHRTNPGIVRGKASYMSPEQCLGDPVDLRTDVFALGVVLYEVATGRRCFQGNTDFERMLAVVQGNFVLPSEHVADFPPALEQVICKALAIKADDRFATASELIEALETVALLEGWTLGTHHTQRMMRGLFGTVVEPWATAQGDDTTYVCPPPVPPPSALDVPQPTVVITKPRRFARGTESDCYETPPLPEPWHDDDAPTRGRRSLARFWAAA